MIDQQYLESFIKKQTGMIMHLSHTIDDFRNFFAKDKETVLVDMKNTCEEVYELISAQFESNGITVRIAGESFAVKGYKNELKQALLNILNNSKDALLEQNQKEGVVDITVDKQNRKLAIADNAGGVKESLLGRIKEPYFTTKEPNKGTGIGLYMTKLIIEDHMEGSLRFYNNNNGLVAEIEL